jgi:CDP-glucose 4,6-dehydratase
VRRLDRNFWEGRRVFVTGHTGFKGGWLSHWLSELGANVYGFSLEPPTIPNLFTVTYLSRYMSDTFIGDIRNLDCLRMAVRKAKPDIVFHLAAQPLVRDSYEFPIHTISTNVLGTANLLEAVRESETVKAIVVITTDKCYENKEWLWPYREEDQLGGRDPYSASKACAELLTSAYDRSFLSSSGVHVATARAGNVIGGGDWANDRLIPDFLRAIGAGESLKIRYPLAVRPWQHVLDPLYGYLLLAERLYKDGGDFSKPWNFGPEEESFKPVKWLIGKMCEAFPDASYEEETTVKHHEATLLKLDSSRAKTLLGWSPRWKLEESLDKTIEWYRAWQRNEDVEALTRMQLKLYTNS